MQEASQSPFGQSDLIIPEVVLVTERPMQAPTNLVYSTAPKLGIDATGKCYCIKGHDDSDVVLAELVGHTLATQFGIKVPHFAIGRFSKSRQPYFASLILEDCFRDIEMHLKANKVADLGMLSKVILLDIWLANNDRNIGNLLGCPKPDAGRGNISLVAIDFEKALTIRSRAPLIEIPTRIPQGGLWPRDSLGRYCRGRIPLEAKLINELKSISTTQIESAVKACFVAIGIDEQARMQMIVDTLISRQNQIEQLAKAEWN